MNLVFYLNISMITGRSFQIYEFDLLSSKAVRAD